MLANVMINIQKKGDVLLMSAVLWTVSTINKINGGNGGIRTSDQEY